MPPPDAALVAIYRGLPHQMWEKKKLWRDLFMTSNRAIGGYRFQAAPRVPSDDLRADLDAALLNAGLYQPYGGPKLCGGYHPDYCFEWRSPKGSFYALLCSGCHEMILIGPETELHCDLHYGRGLALERLLAKSKL